MNVQQLAQAFAERKKGSCHNAKVIIDDEGVARYILHKSCIARHFPDGRAWGHWCGWYTPTTANHLNHIRKALGVDGRRVGYVWADDHNQGAFDLRDPYPQDA